MVRSSTIVNDCALGPIVRMTCLPWSSACGTNFLDALHDGDDEKIKVRRLVPRGELLVEILGKKIVPSQRKETKKDRQEGLRMIR